MEVASLSAFKNAPGNLIGFHLLRVSSRNARLTPAHKALAKMENNSIVKAIITQNIDGLHQKAGSKNVVELHVFDGAVYLHSLPQTVVPRKLSNLYRMKRSPVVLIVDPS